ncbi:RagB/SusD family nutrient uptake outer membrane protein [Butyricimonas faecalis]|uniref:RagB/SusD family nutrient uptake outer membrane protein n=1 Tax=Butyricimonas faecalis TaxID=2093856 RepID=A0A3Q9IL99_9BACT|nr:RagB/SusD family nutrient uptake outer membrane protein [Butyricimonas faecalis]AZS28439.1 RagB/SusD family nutrient uptake outer membrane protein [Butyricimonas faecalis]
MREMKYIILLGFILLGGACNEWLDVEPLGQVDAEKMFEDEKGCLQTLTGAYMLLASTEAYGEELTVGFVDEIVRYWNKASKAYDFDYQDATLVGRFDGTWGKMYEAIANLNLLLQNLKDSDKEKFENYNLIRGEALGLRAYIHLDLLRLFGPVLKEGLNQKSIPYREEFSNQLVTFMTAEEVLGKIEKDLLEAYVLLANDPIKEYGRKAGKNLDNKDLAFQYRGVRMNYYAVCGTLARCYQLKGNYSDALKYAKEIIDATTIFQLLKRDDIMDSKGANLMFERELIWSLYDEKLETKLGAKIYTYFKYTIDLPTRGFVYEDSGYGSVEDYRRVYWWQEAKISTSFWFLAKYARSYESNTSGTSISRKDITIWDKLLPMIRLSEMYYIAAEANLEIDTPEAYRLLNEVRVSRNLTPIPENLQNDKAALKEQIMYECIKEYWGEGKLFYEYKRLYRDIITREGNIRASRALFELPIPDSELEHGGN